MRVSRDVVALGLVFVVLTMSADAALAESIASQLSGLSSPEPFSMSGSLLRMVGGLFLCIGAFTGGVHVYRKYLLKAPVGMRRRLSVIERVSVSAKGSVALVSLDGKEYLVTAGTDTPRIVPVQSSRPELFEESLAQVYRQEESFNA